MLIKELKPGRVEHPRMASRSKTIPMLSSSTLLLYRTHTSAAFWVAWARALDTEDQFFLFMIKLRLNKEDKELSYHFAISRPTVHKIFHTWIEFLFFQLKELKGLTLSRVKPTCIIGAML